jgi:transcriptional regulator with XRE-family HTH domain
VDAFGAAERQRLGRALVRLRTTAGLSQPQVAAKLGWSQPKVSRIESGKQRVTVPEVDRWCRELGASDQRRTELLALAEHALLGPESWEEVGDDAGQQFRAADMEARAGQISIYQPVILPGLLQTATYARRVFSAGPAGEPPDLADRVMGRMERQRILYDESKQLRFVVPEVTLRWPFGPPAEHLEQLDRLAEIMARPNIDLRIMPMVPSPVWRTGGFILFEDLDGEDPPFVHVELLTRPVNIEDTTGVETYQAAFANLLNGAASGEDARALLARIADDYR